MKEFDRLHPFVSFLYFVFVLGFGMFFMHPLCLAISFVSSFAFSVMLRGKRAVRTNILYTLPMIALTAVINPLFNHRGVTVLWYFPDGNPLTAEAIAYGLAAAVMIASIICWFTCYNQIMTSDKFVYLFGKVIPSISLVFSMVLRFVPEFVSTLRETADAQRGIGRDLSTGSIVQRARYGLDILSIAVTRAMENAVETGDSMRSRGYGLKGRTAFAIYKFGKRDLAALVFMVVLGAYTLIGSALGGMAYSYFPSMETAETTVFGTSVFVAYLILCTYPIIMEVREARRWKALKSKI